MRENVVSTSLQSGFIFTKPLRYGRIGVLKMFCRGIAANNPRRATNLLRRLVTMDTLPPHNQNGNLFYQLSFPPIPDVVPHQLEHVTDECSCCGVVCTKCSNLKCIGSFHSDKQKPGGIRRECNICRKESYQKRAAHMSEIKKTYYQEKKEQIVSYRQENADNIKQYKKQYQETHAEEIRHYYSVNRERYSAYSKEYRKTHRDHLNAKKARRRTRKTQAGGAYSAMEWQELLEKYHYTCLSCGRSGVKLTADHVIPVFKGGSSDIKNIQPLCGPCNSSKGTKIIDYRLVWEGGKH